MSRQTKQVTPRGCLISVITGVLFIGAVVTGGFFLSKHADQRMRSNVDKNGAYSKAVVSDKRSNSKGQRVYFMYLYKNEKFQNHEEGEGLYENLDIGDTITIKVDTTDPYESYIISY